MLGNKWRGRRGYEKIEFEYENREENSWDWWNRFKRGWIDLKTKTIVW